MNLTHLKYIVEVERQGSITKAASVLYMGQPNLSKAIREMELDVGITIFKRSAKGVVPTEKGREFLRYAKAIIVQMDKMEQLYKDNGEQRCDLKIITPGWDYIACAIGEFAKKLPPAEQTDIRLGEAGALKAINAVIECEYDLAIISCELSQEGFFTSSGCERELRTQELFTYSPEVLMSKSNPIAAHDQITAEQLAPQTEITHIGSDIPNVSAVLQRQPLHTHGNKRHISADDRRTCFTLLKSVPQTFMFTPPVPDEVLRGSGLIRRKLAEERTCRDILIYRSSYKTTPVDQKFLEEVKKVIAGINPLV